MSVSKIGFSVHLMLLGALGLGGSFGAAPSLAQVPRVLHYQATLAEGAYPVEGRVDVEAAFFADSTGGAPLAGWGEARSGVSVVDGRLSLLLGARTPLPEALFDTAPLYLGLTVNEEALPRLRLTSTAYALRARRAEAVGPGGVGAAALGEGAVTSRALAPGAVTGASLAAASVSTAAVADAAITGPKLAPAAVSTGGLADGAVTSAKMGPSAVVGSVLADGAVTARKLANGAVTASKVATGATVASLNGLTDAVRLVAGDNVTITPNADGGTITVSAAAASDDSQPSARRWKTNIRPLDGLKLVRQLRGVRYEWKESGRTDVGLIAEEVGAVVPEVVTYAPNGSDAQSVNYAKLVALLVEAVKAQHAQLEETRSRLSDITARLEVLEQSDAPPAQGTP